MSLFFIFIFIKTGKKNVFIGFFWEAKKKVEILLHFYVLLWVIGIVGYKEVT